MDQLWYHMSHTSPRKERVRSFPSDKHSQRLSKALLTVGGCVFVSRDASLSELNVAIRNLASTLGCEASITVTGLCAHGVLHGESKTVVHRYKRNRP